MLALLSARFRTWILLVLVLPLLGRVLEAIGLRVAPKRPRAGNVLTGAGQRMQHRGRRRRRFRT